MKLASRDGNELVFALHHWERASLAAVLSHYPQVPADGFEVTKNGLGRQAGQDETLHEELISDHQKTNHARVRQFVGEKLAAADGTDPEQMYAVKLDTDDITWLLQVLNDIRVGSWIKLGRPDEGALAKLAGSKQAVGVIGVMEFCAYAQSVLLDSVMD